MAENIARKTSKKRIFLIIFVLLVVILFFAFGKTIINRVDVINKYGGYLCEEVYQTKYNLTYKEPVSPTVKNGVTFDMQPFNLHEVKLDEGTGLGAWENESADFNILISEISTNDVLFLSYLQAWSTSELNDPFKEFLDVNDICNGADLHSASFRLSRSQVGFFDYLFAPNYKMLELIILSDVQHLNYNGNTDEPLYSADFDGGSLRFITQAEKEDGCTRYNTFVYIIEDGAVIGSFSLLITDKGNNVTSLEDLARLFETMSCDTSVEVEILS